MPITHIFITGATGYIGGSVLTRLLNHSKSNTFRISALVRSAEKAKKLDDLGVSAVVGSFSDLNLLTALSSQSDVVFACADADNLNAAKGILDGLRLRHSRTGVSPVLIHTSGTGVLADDVRGMCSTDTIYSDLDIAHLETLPPTQPHRKVDLTIVEADNEGYVKTYIILPSTIYGVASGILVDHSIQHSHSQQIPRLIESSVNRGQGGMIGAGENVWPNVHIDEIADLYIILFDAILSGNPPGALEHGRSGFYFGENDEYRLYDLCKAVAVALYDCGRGKSFEPTTFSDEESLALQQKTLLGSNSRCRAERSKALGWKPVKLTLDMLRSVEPEVKVWLRDHEKESRELPV